MGSLRRLGMTARLVPWGQRRRVLGWMIAATFGVLSPGLASSQQSAVPQQPAAGGSSFPLQIGLRTGEPRFHPEEDGRAYCFRGMDDGQKVDWTEPLERRRYYGLYLEASGRGSPSATIAERYVYVLGWGDNGGKAQRTVLWPVTCGAAGGACECEPEPDRARHGARFESRGCPLARDALEVPLVTIRDRLPGARKIILIASSKPIPVCSQWEKDRCVDENGGHCGRCSGVRCGDPYDAESLRASLDALTGAEVWQEVPIEFATPPTTTAPRGQPTSP